MPNHPTNPYTGDLEERAELRFDLSPSSTVSGLPWWLRGKVSVCNAGDQGSIPGLGRSPGEGNGSPLQYACLENPMDSRGW